MRCKMQADARDTEQARSAGHPFYQLLGKADHPEDFVELEVERGDTSAWFFGRKSGLLTKEGLQVSPKKGETWELQVAWGLRVTSGIRLDNISC